MGFTKRLDRCLSIKPLTHVPVPQWMTRVWSSFPSQFKSGKALSSLDPWKAVTVTAAAQVMRVIFFLT
jgi:hypothetical protein